MRLVWENICFNIEWYPQRRKCGRRRVDSSIGCAQCPFTFSCAQSPFTFRWTNFEGYGYWIIVQGVFAKCSPFVWCLHPPITNIVLCGRMWVKVRPASWVLSPQSPIHKNPHGDGRWHVCHSDAANIHTQDGSRTIRRLQLHVVQKEKSKVRFVDG